MTRDYLYGEPRDVFRLTVAAVSDMSGVPVEDIMGDSHRGPAVAARHAAMYLVRKARKSYPQIGLWFNRDHTTVMDAVRKVEANPQAYPIGE